MYSGSRGHGQSVRAVRHGQSDRTSALEMSNGSIHAHLRDDEWALGREQIFADVANKSDEIRRIFGGVLRADHVVPALEPNETGQFGGLAFDRGEKLSGVRESGADFSDHFAI